MAEEELLRIENLKFFTTEECFLTIQFLFFANKIFKEATTVKFVHRRMNSMEYLSIGKYRKLKIFANYLKFLPW